MFPRTSSSSTSPDPPPASTSPDLGKRNQPSAPRIRRRNRLITSCLECRRRKLKCDKLHPCSNCTRFARDCVFLAPALDPQAQLRLAEIKEKMGSLERTLEEDVARGQHGPDKHKAGEPLSSQQDEESDGEDTPEDEKDLEPTPFAMADVAYGEDVDDDIVDLGIQMGKMRITERIGGFARPKMAEELKQGLAKLPTEKNPTDPNALFGAQRLPGFDMTAALRPGRDFVAPSSSFFFATDPRKSSLLHYLPSKVTADRLLEHYWMAVHPIARIVHRPTFERKYDAFWKEVAVGMHPKASFQAILLGALLSAAISLSDETVVSDYGVGKEEFVDNFRQGVEAALGRANFLRTTKLETVQALVMYLIPLCRREISRAHSALVGTTIRLAECMSLHRDGTHFGLPPVEVHVRRLIWYQLCFLDIRACEATGPRPQIRDEDYDTKLPLNINDADLELPEPPTHDSDQFTDMTLSRIRFECNEMHRLIWFERPRIERKKTTLTSLLGKVEKFRAAMEKMYYPMLDPKIPLHYFGIQLYSILSLRMHTMVLHRYASNAHRLMPDRLRHIILSSGTLLIEHGMNVETNPTLKPWAWYSGALQQYHIALLLLSEAYAKPPDPVTETRIWRALDYAFEVPTHLNPLQKSRLILTEMAMKSEAYANLRRMKLPTKMTTLSDKSLKSPGHIWTFNENWRKEYSMKGGLASGTSELVPQQDSGSSSSAAVPQSNDPPAQGEAPTGQALGNVPGPAPGPAVNHPAAFQMPPGMSAQTLPHPSAAVPPPRHTQFGISVFPSESGGAPNVPPQNVAPQNAPPHPYSRPEVTQAMQSNVTRTHMGMAPLDSINRSGSDTSSVQFGRQSSSVGSSRSPDGEMMLDIDWNEWDKLFPPDANNTGNDINIPPFSYPEYAGGLAWQ